MRRGTRRVSAAAPRHTGAAGPVHVEFHSVLRLITGPVRLRLRIIQPRCVRYRIAVDTHSGMFPPLL